MLLCVLQAGHHRYSEQSNCQNGEERAESGGNLQLNGGEKENNQMKKRRNNEIF